MANSENFVPAPMPKALTLGIHLAWLTFGLSCTTSWADGGETRKALMTRQPASLPVTLPTDSHSHRTSVQKKSPTQKKPVLTAPTHSRLAHDFVKPDPLVPASTKPTGTTLSLDTSFNDGLDDKIDTLLNTHSTPNPLATPSKPSIARTTAKTDTPPPQTINPQTINSQTANPQADNAQTPTTDNSQSEIASRLDDTTFVTRQSTTALVPARGSLERLVDFYQQGNHDASCQGNWHYPYPTKFTAGLTASANYGYYNAKNLAELSGNVIINQDRHQIRAGKITLNPLTGQSHATGNVTFGSSGDETDEPQNIKLSRLPKSDLMGLAERLDYNSKTGQAYAHNVAFASRSLHAHGYAKTLQQQDNSSYQLQDVIFSTCPPANRLWHIHADSINLDKETGRGTTTHTTLNIKNVPVFYLPYFNFPIDDRRSSGFLTPHLGINSKDGLQLSAPYYFNLAPNYDATVTPTLYTNRNPRVLAEFRYLTRHFGEGKIDTAYLPSDKQYNHNDRQHAFFDHYYKPFADKDLSVSATYRYVSDSSYLSDFDKMGLDNNPLNLPRRVTAEYKTDNLSLTARAETFQKLRGTDHLGNPILDKDRPYARLPQVSFRYHLPSTDLKQHLQAKHIPQHYLTWLDKHDLSLSGTHDIAYFKKSIKDSSAIEKSGIRLYNQVAGSYSVVKPWGFFTPTARLTHLYTAYDEHSTATHGLTTEDNDFSVLLPSVSLDMGLFLQKQGTPFGLTSKKGTGRQLLSPRLKYLYTPHKNQADIPNFDTSQASISYDQLLSDSWFLGYDRISDLHAITPALNYRYIDGKGATRLDVGIAKQFYLDSPKVGLDNAVPSNINSSELAWQVSARPHADVWLDLAGTLTHNTPSSFVGMVNYRPYDNMQFGFGMVERKDNATLRQLPLSAYTASIIYPLSPQWQVMATTQYDANYRQFMDTLVGLNYEDCCIGVSVYGRQHRNELNPTEKPDHTVMAELRLNGLAGGQKFAQLLKERIVGYPQTR